MCRTRFSWLVGILALVVCTFTATASAATTASGSTGATSAEPQLIDDASLEASTTTVGGADVLPTTKTVAHWWGSTSNPHNGITYGYNMVGADPNNCVGSACSTTITADVIPVNVVIGDRTFAASDVVGPTLASPVFSANDYGSTPNATAPAARRPGVRGPGGTLSQDDAGQPLQVEDATMRAQFDKTGPSPYHLILDPVVHDPVTIVVPKSDGVPVKGGRGVVFADVNVVWWATRIQNLNASLGYIDPTHLPIYLTKDVLNYYRVPEYCCVIGFHGAGKVTGQSGRGVNGNGDDPVQTWAWASWASPGLYARPDGGLYWALQDIHAVTHEIAEWADDPFGTNRVEPWLTPTAPQYGCSSLLETGDPVVGVGFAVGKNTHDQGPNPDGSQSADGYYHPEDEVFLPWFMRTAPNHVSEPTQSPSVNGGRYSLLGDLNPFAGFRQPATGC